MNLKLNLKTILRPANWIGIFRGVVTFAAKHLFVFALLALAAGITITALLVYNYDLNVKTLTAAQSKVLGFDSDNYELVIKLYANQQAAYAKVREAAYNNLFKTK